jgi:hypothetical protein
MTTASDAIVRAYLEAVQAARRTPAADEPWRRVAAMLATGGSPEAVAVGCGPSS